MTVYNNIIIDLLVMSTLTAAASKLHLSGSSTFFLVKLYDLQSILTCEFASGAKYSTQISLALAATFF